jgi:hypothetical protein
LRNGVTLNWLSNMSISHIEVRRYEDCFALNLGTDFPIGQLRFHDGWQRNATFYVLVYEKADFFGAQPCS